MKKSAKRRCSNRIALQFLDRALTPDRSAMVKAGSMSTIESNFADL
jgi:hypothetical protein